MKTFLIFSLFFFTSPVFSKNKLGERIFPGTILSIDEEFYKIKDMETGSIGFFSKESNISSREKKYQINDNIILKIPVYLESEEISDNDLTLVSFEEKKSLLFSFLENLEETYTAQEEENEDEEIKSSLNFDFFEYFITNAHANITIPPRTPCFIGGWMVSYINENKGTCSVPKNNKEDQKNNKYYKCNPSGKRCNPAIFGWPKDDSLGFCVQGTKWGRSFTKACIKESKNPNTIFEKEEIEIYLKEINRLCAQNPYKNKNKTACGILMTRIKEIKKEIEDDCKVKNIKTTEAAKKCKIKHYSCSNQEISLEKIPETCIASTTPPKCDFSLTCKTQTSPNKKITLLLSNCSCNLNKDNLTTNESDCETENPIFIKESSKPK